MYTREYPELPMVGVGGVVIAEERALLVRRATAPALGEWSIPGGLLELGETLREGVARELREETGLTVRVLELVEAVDRIFTDSDGHGSDGRAPVEVAQAGEQKRTRYHFVILDFLCELVGGEAQANEEISAMAFVREEELDRYELNPITLQVLRKAFALARRQKAR